jgi:hypothetical protein
MKTTIFFFLGFVLGFIIQWIFEDKRINRLTVENRQLNQDNQTLKKLLARFKSSGNGKE